MNYIVVYDPPGGAYWDLDPKIKADIEALDGVVAVRKSHTYSLQPHLFEDIERPVCVICWGVEDRYDYEGRAIDRLEYVDAALDIEQIVQGKVRLKEDRDGFIYITWVDPEELPANVELQTQRRSDMTPTERFYSAIPIETTT